MEPLVDWARVDQALDEALEQPPSTRAAWLQSLGQTDPALRLAVERLLGALDSAPGFLERPLAHVAPALVVECLEGGPEGSELPASSTIGPWRLQRELGHGGMGTVYLAERADGAFQKAVAIKVVRPGAGVLGHDRRFEAERRMLAGLEHPGIARLLDAGTTGEGVNYLVMEYVDGIPVDQFIARHALPLERRLDLFDQVAAAVQHAHQQLIVHRDLKPANILVTESGVVKLLDFGIAKLLDADEGEALTGRGMLLATPAWASPEQLRGGPISTTSDVYALGVLLHQLLSDGSPYRVGPRPSGQDLATAITELPPLAPSAVARDPARRAALAGDLDAIILTALAKEPERRYPSVDHLREDLRRHRAGFAVRARPPTRRYRLAKFASRNRHRLAAGILVVGGLMAGGALALWQARAAARHAEESERITRFVEEIFQGSDPDQVQGGEVSARDLLHRGAARLATDLDEVPTVRAGMMAVVAGLYQRLGQLDSAAGLLERAVRLDDSLGASTPGRADRLAALASLRFDQGDFPAADSLAGQALATFRRTVRPADPRISGSIADLAAARAARGEWQEADSLFRAALAIERRRGDSAAAAATLGRLGRLLWEQGAHDQAVPLLEEALAADMSHHGEIHTRTATSLQRLGTALMDQGHFDSATAMLDRAVAIRERLLGPDHPLLASTIGNLADLYQRHGRLAEAEAANLRALAIRLGSLGETHPEVALSHNNLAVVQYFLARHDEAARGFAQALAIWRPLLGDEHPRVLAGLNNLGAVHRAAGNLGAAEQMLEEVLAIRVRQHGDAHQDVAQSRNNLALLHALQGRHREAEAGFVAATRIWKATLGDRHPTAAFGLASHGRFLSDQGRCQEAEPILREAVDLRQAGLDSASTDLAVSRRELAICLGRLGQPAEAAALLDLAIPVMRRTWGEDNVGTRRALEAAAELAAEPATLARRSPSRP